MKVDLKVVAINIWQSLKPVLQTIVFWKLLAVCCIQSYCEASILVWCPKLRPQAVKWVKINSSKNKQMTIHVLHVLVPQCVLSVLSYLECKISKVFQDFAHRPHWRGLTAPPPPRLPNSKTGFFPCYTSQKTANPLKFLDTALIWSICKMQSTSI